jgi:hypothetical protein
MKGVRLLFGVIVLGTCIGAPMVASAQRWRRPIIVIDPVYAPPHGGWHVRSLVDDVERESNSMRYVFEHEITHRSHRERDRLADAKAAIQRMDESFERLRHYADDARPRAGRDEMRTVLDRAIDVNGFVVHQRDVDDIVGRRWDQLHDDINRLARMYELDELPRR